MSGARAGAGAGPSSPALRLRGEDGRAEWLRFYDRVEAQVEALATDRAHLGATRGEGEEAILPADRLAELQEGDLEDAKVCRGLLTLRNTESDSEEIQDRPELGEKTRDHEQSVKASRANLRELKGVFETLMSQKDKDVYSVKDVLFNQLRTMEKNKMLFENKKSEAAQAIEEAKKLQQNVQALHTTAQNKDDEIVRLQAEALVAQQKLHEMGSLLKEKDEVIEKLRAENIGLLAVKDFVWSQFQIKEQEYAMLLKNKEVAAAQATEATQKLVKENRKMEAEVVDYGNKLLIIEDKLKEMGCLAKEKDDEIQELKNHQPEITSLKRKCASSLSNETSKKRMMDIIGMHITCIGRCKSGRLCFGHRMMQIFVKVTNSRTCTLKVKSSNMIEDVEAIMRDHHLDVQGLIFAGKKLVYGRTLADYNIKNLSTLQLVLHLRISVKMLNGKIIDLAVKSSDTIKYVKEMIQSQEDIRWGEQGLIFADKRLKDGCTLADYDIETSCTFELVPLLRLRVKKLNKEIIDLAVLSSNKIEDVKEMIYHQEGASSCMQSLFFASKHLEDDRTLADYNIHKDCTFHLVLSFSWDRVRVIRIKMSTGKTWFGVVRIGTTIKAVKAFIHKDEGIPPSQQRLFFAGKPMHNDRTLESYISGDWKVIVIHLLHLRVLQPRRIMDRARRLLNKPEPVQGCL
ncbi:Polyubiquitin-A [Hordeum vulgare]|nr:Polyubiquitin-A [Hordeum vulgare]